MKYIFLDVDGVMNSLETFLTMDGRGWKWSPMSVGFVRLLCEKTGARIVVSSTWRGHSSVEQLQAEWPEFGAAPLVEFIVGRTPQTNEMPAIADPTARRGCEIQHWLAKHKHEAYLILDDDSDMLPEQRPFFVQTMFTHGFGIKEYVKALRILGHEDAGLEQHLAQDRKAATC